MKGKKRMTSSTVDGFSYSGDGYWVEDQKDQFRNRSSWRSVACIHVAAKS